MSQGIRIPEEQRAAVVRFLQAGRPCREVAAELGVTPRTVQRIAAAAGVTRARGPSVRSYGSRLSDEQRRGVVKFLQNGLPYGDVAAMFRVSVRTVGRIAAAMPLHCRGYGDAIRRLVESRLEAGRSHLAIAEATGVSRAYVSRVVASDPNRFRRHDRHLLPPETDEQVIREAAAAVMADGTGPVRVLAADEHDGRLMVVVRREYVGMFGELSYGEPEVVPASALRGYQKNRTPQ
jgi:uncharacterized protein YerC